MLCVAPCTRTLQSMLWVSLKSIQSSRAYSGKAELRICQILWAFVGTNTTSSEPMNLHINHHPSPKWVRTWDDLLGEASNQLQNHLTTQYTCLRIGNRSASVNKTLINFLT